MTLAVVTVTGIHETWWNCQTGIRLGNLAIMFKYATVLMDDHGKSMYCMNMDKWWYNIINYTWYHFIDIQLTVWSNTTPILLRYVWPLCAPHRGRIHGLRRILGLAGCLGSSVSAMRLFYLHVLIVKAATWWFCKWIFIFSESKALKNSKHPARKPRSVAPDTSRQVLKCRACFLHMESSAPHHRRTGTVYFLRTWLSSQRHKEAKVGLYLWK